MKYSRQFSMMGDAVESTVFEKDMNMMRQLTRVVFNRWYSDLLQENLRVVPDLDGSYKTGNDEAAMSHNNAFAGALSQSEEEIPKKSLMLTSSPPPPAIRKKVPVHLQ